MSTAPHDGAVTPRAAELVWLVAGFVVTALDLSRRAREWPLHRESLAGMPVDEALRLSAAADRSWTRLGAVTSFWMREPLGPGPAEAWRLDRSWRGDRTLGPGDVLRSLASSARSSRRPDLRRALAALAQGRPARAVRMMGEGPAADDPACAQALRRVRDALLDVAAERGTRSLPATGELRRALAVLLPPLVPPAPPVPAGRPAAGPAPDAAVPVPPAYAPGPVDEAARPLVVCRTDERVGGLPRLSASQLESYGECPGKWLALRRLSLGRVDATFDGAAVGSLVHRVLERVHRRLYEEACAAAGVDPDERPLTPVRGSAVAPDTLGRALELLDEELAGDLGDQVRTYRRAAQQSVVPHSAEELARLSAVADELAGFLSWEAAHGDGLQPRWFEAAFGRECPQVLGGASFVGTVDRIDVAPDGLARIVDYKHRSAAEEYCTASGPVAAPAPRHAQAYLYALMVDGVDPRLRPGSALYEGTVAPWEPAGAGTAEGLGSTVMLPFVNDMQPDAFSAVLHTVADDVAASVGSILAGRLAPAPVDARACAFCPAPGCPRRRSPEGAPVDDAALSPEFQVSAAATFLSQPGDTARGLAPLLVGPLFSLSAGDLLLLATGCDPQTGRLSHRRLDRGVLAGEAGLAAPPSSRLAHALAVLGGAVSAAATMPLDAAVRTLVEGSGWPGRLAASHAPGDAATLARLTAALSRLSCSEVRARRAL